LGGAVLGYGVLWLVSWGFEKMGWQEKKAWAKAILNCWQAWAHGWAFGV
jgi:hypothetical protein